MKRRSLHIGLNTVDPDKYGGWNGALRGCVNDALAMRDIAVDRGFEPTLLLDQQATVGNVRTQLDSAADILADGDYFFLTYSGHGGQIPDQDRDESDALDETWCLFDTELVDDSLYGALCRFASGVKIFVMSDSCHSETVTRQAVVDARETAAASESAKRAPATVTAAEFDSHRARYDEQRTWWTPVSTPKAAAAAVVLLAGCRDSETSRDGPVNGAFTGAFLEVWRGGKFTGDYVRLATQVRRRLEGRGQTPSLFSYGPRVADLLSERPLRMR